MKASTAQVSVASGLWPARRGTTRLTWSRLLPGLWHGLASTGSPDTADTNYHTPFGGFASRPDARCFASTKRASSSGTSAIPSQWQSTDDVVYWQRAMQAVDNLDWGHVLGVAKPRTLVQGVVGPGIRRPRTSVPGYDFFLDIKARHPRCVVLVRIGEFYEAVGFDALVLCQHCGLNPMSPDSGIARAGCPVINLRRTLAQLVEAGFTTVVCEEADSPADRTGRKRRYIGGCVSPAQPFYLSGLSEEEDDLGGSNERSWECRPLLGLSASKRGYCLLELDVSESELRIHDALTEEAVLARINAGGLAPPLLLHDSVSRIMPTYQSTTQAISSRVSASYWAAKLRRLVRAQVGLVEMYSGPDATAAFELAAARLLGRDVSELQPDKPMFKRLPVQQDGRPRPPYLSTATQLGLTGAPGIPSLMDAVLPLNTPALCRSWLRSLLLLPPPPEIAGGISSTIHQLAHLAVPLPALYNSLTPARLQSVLEAKQGSAGFFREIAGLLSPVIQLLRQPELSPVLASVLTVVHWQHPATQAFSAAVLHSKLEQALGTIEVFVLLEGSPTLTDGDEEPGEADGEEVAEVVVSSDDAEIVLARYFTMMERPFRGRVQDSCISKQLSAVDHSRRQVQEVLLAALQPLQEGARATRDPARLMPRAAADRFNRAVWLLVPKGSGSRRHESFAQLHHPLDRNGKRVDDRLSNQHLDEALAAYRSAVDDTTKAVRAQLRQLCDTLQPQLLPLLAACHLSTVLGALHAHAQAAHDQGWVQPTLWHELQRGLETPILKATGMWPYWRAKDDPATVCNDVDLIGMALLTGANMAGKSTLLRCIAALALLANCGLCVPAASAQVPRYDAFMLRNFSGDSPVEGKSSFAMEMEDVRSVIQDCTSRSLVLLDELGKGTEVAAASALAAVLLRRLCLAGASGVFASHLHDLLWLCRDLQHTGKVHYWAMQLTQDPGRPGHWLPTWRVLPGECTESLAFEVAAAAGLPLDLLQEARACHVHLRQLQENARPINGRSMPQLLSSMSANATDDIRVSVHVDDASSLLDAQNTSLGQGQGLSPSQPDPSPMWHEQWRQALSLLHSTTNHVCSNTAGFAEGQLLQPVELPTGSVPPVRHNNMAVVYIVRFCSGQFYCGESDSIRRRQTEHQSTNRRMAKAALHIHRQADMQMAYVPLPAELGGKSLARAIESQLIQNLQNAGLALISSRDKSHKTFAKVQAKAGVT